MDIVNECRIDFKYRLSPQSPIISKTIFSNLVSTQIIENTLKMTKYVDKKETYAFDILTYTIIIENIREFDVTNIFFHDTIQKGTQFIENSVEVNNRKRRCISPEQGFYLGCLTSGEKVKITFNVLVLPMYFHNLIKNYSDIEYDYIYNIEKPPIKVNEKSNEVKVKYKNKVFLQTVLGNTIKTYAYIEEILDISCKLEIIKTKLITSIDLDKCTVLVIGKIKYEILFKSLHYKRYIEDTFGFSTCMMAPIGMIYSNKDNIKINIEYLKANLLNKNSIYITTSLLIYY